PQILNSPDIVLVAVFDELLRETRKKSRKITKSALNNIKARFSEKDFGPGIIRILKTSPSLDKMTDFLNVVGRSGVVPEMDSVARHTDNKRDLHGFAIELEKILLSDESKKLSRVKLLITSKLKTLELKS
ncbi:MAG: hypothetical protein OEX07_15310, partial [Gammaproteobacteria bacterium]|nr:hypothetical protein [Gammaproteobacteria bacterium]